MIAFIYTLVHNNHTQMSDSLRFTALTLSSLLEVVVCVRVRVCVPEQRVSSVRKCRPPADQLGRLRPSTAEAAIDRAAALCFCAQPRASLGPISPPVTRLTLDSELDAKC